MKKMVISITAAILLGALFAGPSQAQAKKPVIQMAILLDTSGSMDGLINQARTQLWKVVNQFVSTKKDGVRPELQVAVFEYGNDGLPADGGYLRMVTPLNTDLDAVSEALFALKTNGGSEHCGQVIQAAVNSLSWSPSPGDLKVIFIAGNEPFTQGPVDFRQAVKAAIAKGIMVNTIFCGNRTEGENTGWKEGAMLADGSYMAIDQNRPVLEIAAPQDAEIRRLNDELNRTYVAYGSRGRTAKARQEAQDKKAESVAPAAAAERAAFKSSGSYSTSGWDLVDAVKEGKAKAGAIPAEELPEEMRGMNAEQQKAYLEAQQKKRAELQAKIQKLAEERKKYIADKQKEAAAGDTLDGAMIQSVREQAKKKSFQIE